MFKAAVVLLSVLVFQVLAAPISTNCGENIDNADKFFDAIDSGSLTNIQNSYAASYTGNTMSFALPYLYNTISSNITVFMGDWQYFFDSWVVVDLGSELRACFEDGRVLLRTVQTLTHKTSGRTIYGSRSWYLLTFDTDGYIVNYQVTWNNLLESEAAQPVSVKYLNYGGGADRVVERDEPVLNCTSITETLNILAAAISTKNSTKITELYANEFTGITPSFSLPNIYETIGNISSQKANWDYFFGAWNFDSQSFEIACDEDYLGGAFFRHQQNMTSTVTGNKVYGSQSWYYIVFDAEVKIIQIDNTWNTYLESLASTPAATTTDSSTTGSSADYQHVSVLLLAIVTLIASLI